ncbi:Obscurin [Labeo rohita]|uniref:Obscurin n=1 Tax=Labeo rohita TaxID=84645 RepID=A0ABQ8LAZ1_LABRO|nr:Obscurin [Labeo rohita]
MDNPAVLLLLLEQGNRSLEDHTRDFVYLAPLTHYPDSCLCTFYRAGLNTTTKVQLSGEGPRESIADYIKWVLYEPEPTADEEPEPRVTEPEIATEPEPYTSDQVREPATATATVECNREQVRAMESPAHCTTAGGELENNSGDLIDFFSEVLEHNSGDLIDFFTELSTCYDQPACLEFPPTLPLLPMSTGLAAGLPVSIGVNAGGSLISASSLRVQNSASALRPYGSTTALSALAPLSPVGPPAPPGFLVSPAPPWSVVVPPSPQDSAPLAAPRHFVPPAPKDSSLPPAQPQSSVAPAPQRTSGSPPPPWSPEPRAPPWPSGSSVSSRVFGSPSLPRAPLPAAPPLSVSPLESSALPPPWLLPPSAPPWVVIMAAVWVSLSFSCSGSFRFPPWLLPSSSPPWTVLFAPRTLFFVPLPGFRPPPKPPPT